MEVREERTGWRDLGLSQRHRQWGWDCPAVDIDFLMLEYDNSKAIGLIEYKHENAKPLPPNHPSRRALEDLADRAGIYFFGCRYADDYSWYKVVAGNAKARALLPKSREFSEQEFVAFLYQLRGTQPVLA